MQWAEGRRAAGGGVNPAHRQHEVGHPHHQRGVCTPAPSGPLCCLLQRQGLHLWRNGEHQSHFGKRLHLVPCLLSLSHTAVLTTTSDRHNRKAVHTLALQLQWWLNDSHSFTCPYHVRRTQNSLQWQQQGYHPSGIGACLASICPNTELRCSTLQASSSTTRNLIDKVVVHGRGRAVCC